MTTKLELQCMHCGKRREWHHCLELNCLVDGVRLNTFYEPWPDQTNHRGRKPHPPAILGKEYLPDRKARNARETVKRAGGPRKLMQVSPEVRRLLLGNSEKYDYQALLYGENNEEKSV